MANGPISVSGSFRDLISLIWSIAELLRGPYKESEYGKVVLPFTVLRRLDCVLAPTKKAVLETKDKAKAMKLKDPDLLLRKASRQSFYNASKYDFEKLTKDPNHIKDNLRDYINGFSQNVRDIMERFNFDAQIERLDDKDRLFAVLARFADSQVDLSPAVVSNEDMGRLYEELIRRFAEQSNETAGEHFTPREVIRLMVNLLFIEERDILTQKGIVKTLYDPACGTGGMLSVAEEYVQELNPDARLELFGQEVNDESYAVCKSDILIKGFNPNNIRLGDSFSQDQFEGDKFDYMLSNPPFGVEWKPQEKFIRDEHEKKGFAGRFGAGLPRINDGAMLFIQHMISKMRPEGSRLAIVFNGSPLFTGGAESGESEIRRWIIENDWLEGIVAMPTDMFYNTGIATYVWVVTNRKHLKRKGKIQLVDATSYYQKMRRCLGEKRSEMSPEHIAEVCRIYGEFTPGNLCKIFDNEDFGYWRVTVERPLRMNFSFAPERIERVKESPAFANLANSKKKEGSKAAETEIADGKALQGVIQKALSGENGSKVYKNREEFLEILRGAFKKAKVSVPTPLFRAISNALSERDETANICMEVDGNTEPDADLRDTENVPLKEDIGKYFKREVLPHATNAWVDAKKTKKGYEINFNRYFYEYVPPRSLEEIGAEIKALEDEVQGMLKEILA
jgi:type I restriction enzyme M protein